MDSQHSRASPFPWIWVYEMLAQSNQVDVSLLCCNYNEAISCFWRSIVNGFDYMFLRGLITYLYATIDLVEKTPEITNYMPINVGELVPLRILENINIQAASVSPLSSAPKQKNRFDPSEQCEDVVRRILPEKSVSNLKTAGKEMLQWDFQPFIAHKRSRLAKCFLQQLKDAILKGGHPPLESLKEQSGLLIGNEPQHIAPVDNGDRDGNIPRVEGNAANTRICSPNDQLISSSFANSTYLLHGNLPDENLLPAKRKRDDPAENSVGKSCKDHIVLENRCKTCVEVVKYTHEIISRVKVLRVKLNSLGIDRQTPGVSTFTPVVLCTEGESCRFDEGTHDGVKGLKEPPGDHNVKCTSCKGLIDHDAVIPCEKQVTHDDTEAPIYKSDIEHGLAHRVKEVNGNEEEVRIVRIIEDKREKSKKNLAGHVEAFPCQCDDASYQVPKTRERHAEIRPKKGVPPECSPSVECADAEQMSEQYSRVSKYFTRVQKQDKQHSYPAIPQLKRKRLPWTSAEEEKLKEDMQIVCGSADRVIPWKNILEFGAGTFLTSRTTVDLKDKWRNICKAAAKS